MKKQLLAALPIALFSAVAFGQIANTPHNLGSSNTSGPNSVSDTADICVFCHTPHQANTTAATTALVPLWNKRLSSTTYTTYGATASLDSQVLAVGSVSLACLSCHDGTQAMDNIINAAGSGGVTADGGDVNGLGYNWTGSGSADANGFMSASSAANIGNDLTNDHPIGVGFCGGGLSSTTSTVGGTCADLDFKSANVQTRNTGSGQIWWVDVAGGTAATREKTDIQLYQRTFTAGAQPSVECASCHDPHAERKATNQVNFMRVTTAGSQICLACHTK